MNADQTATADPALTADTVPANQTISADLTNSTDTVASTEDAISDADAQALEGGSRVALPPRSPDPAELLAEQQAADVSEPPRLRVTQTCCTCCPDSQIRPVPSERAKSR